MDDAMINVNWLPVPGLVTAVLGLALLGVSVLAHRQAWAPRGWTVGAGITFAGTLALFLGVVIGVHLVGLR